MKSSTKHYLIPTFAVLAFIIGLSCSPRAIAAMEGLASISMPAAAC